MLNVKQQEAIDYIKKGNNIFLTGMAGTGKTFTINVLRKYLTETKKKYAITSTTGVSAILLKGTTIHSFLGIGLGTGNLDSLYAKIFNKKYLYQRWKKLEVLVIDEISMLSSELFDKIEELARMLRQNTKPFGGIQLILTGDFLQLPPIKNNSFCFESKSWDKCVDKIIYLMENLRQDDIIFQKCLDEIRMGYVSSKTEELMKSRENIEINTTTGIFPTKIFSINYEVDSINQNELDKLATNIYEYEMEFEIFCQDFIFQKLKKSCNMVEKLQICVGAQVMLLANIDITGGLVNGSRGVVTKFTEDDLPVVRFINGTETIIEYHRTEIEEEDKLLLVITQIPLRVAFAVSAHKIQGSTLDYAEVDLKNIFTYSQSYVALSRVRNIEGLVVRNFDKNKITAHPKAIEFYNNII